MKKPVAIVGIGQMGGVFAKGFLKAGYPVYPVVSGMSIESSARQMPECDFVLLAVPENKLHAVIQLVPNQWKSKLGLLQNELLPRDWWAEGIKTVTAMAVWFEKKKGQRVTVFQPTPVFGPHAETVKDALHEVDIPCKVLSSSGELLIELVKKNVYVLTINIAGLEKGGTTGELLNHHLDFAKDIAGEVIGIQEWLTKTRFDRDELISSMILMLEKVPEHKCRGRVAQERFDRTIAYAVEAGIGTPVLNGIAERILNP
jgi:ketopantoate reductase